MEEEIIKTIFSDFIQQYNKTNTCNVVMLKNGDTTILKKIKVTQKQIDFMEDYLGE